MKKIYTHYSIKKTSNTYIGLLILAELNFFSWVEIQNQSQYHDWWCPGDASRQGIISLDIDPLFSKHSSLTSRKVMIFFLPIQVCLTQSFQYLQVKYKFHLCKHSSHQHVFYVHRPTTMLPSWSMTGELWNRHSFRTSAVKVILSQGHKCHTNQDVKIIALKGQWMKDVTPVHW